MRSLHPPSPRATCAAVLALATVLMLGGPATAQEPQGAEIAAYQLRVGPADFGAGVRISERQSGLRASTAEFSFERFGFRAGADYAYTRYAFEGLQTRARDLHHLFVPLQWRDRQDRWLAVVTPVIATSSNVFKDLVNRGSRDDFDLHLRLQVQDWSDQGLGWRAGVVRDTAFGAARFYPTAALLWKAARVQAELGLPSSRIDWQVKDDLAFGAALFPSGGSWHVISDERAGAQFDYRASAWRGALTAQWQALSWLRVSAQAGLEFHRNYELVDDTGAAIDRDAGSARYWRIELRIGFRS